MKRVLLISILTILSINLSRAQNYGLDNADPTVFTKFKVPDTDLRTLWINTGLNLTTNKQTQSYFSDISSYNSNFNFNLNPNYLLLNETDNRYLALSASLYTSYSKVYSESKTSYDPITNVNNSKTYNGNLSLQFTLNNYINPEEVFYSLGSDILVQMNDNKSDQTQTTSTSYYQGYKLQNYVFSFGIGIGKIRNVTSVVSAIRLQERLKQLNLINNDLNENTIEDLAQQFYKQSYYSQVHDRPDKYFWQGVDKVLSNDGISLNGLNMYADNYLRETVNEIRFMRLEGLIAQIGLQLNYQNNYESIAIFKISEQLYTLANLYLAYSHQMDLNSQIGFNISLSGGPNVLANPKFRQQYYIVTGINYDYEITDRLVASINNSFSLLFQNANYGTKDLSNSLSLTGNYFIEDNLSLNASYQWHYSDMRYYSLQSNTLNYNSVNLGFTYYFERGFLYK